MILHCAPTEFHLFVNTERLWHSGSITDRVNPDTLQPTCFLAPRTVVNVRINNTILPLEDMNTLYPESSLDLDDSEDEQHDDLSSGDNRDSAANRIPSDGCTPCLGADSMDSSSSVDPPSRFRALSRSTITNDEKLTDLYRQLAAINAQILARWTAIIASDPSTFQSSQTGR